MIISGSNAELEASKPVCEVMVGLQLAWTKLVCLTLKHCIFSLCMFKLNTTYQHTGVTACTADGKSAWIQVSQLLCSLHYIAWQIHTTQLCRCENLCLKYPIYTHSSRTISSALYPNPVCRVWIEDQQLVKTFWTHVAVSSSTNALLVFYSWQYIL